MSPKGNTIVLKRIVTEVSLNSS